MAIIACLVIGAALAFGAAKLHRRLAARARLQRVALLKALLQGDGYAVSLADRVEKLTLGRIRIGAWIFRELRSMELDGLVRLKENGPRAERGDWPRFGYRLTDLGIRVAQACAAGRLP